MSNNPATFAPLSVAEAAAQRGGYDGIGVGIFGNIGAIDIDHCVGDTGELSELAADIMQTMGSYTEYSPSGKGLRILFTMPDGFQYDKTKFYINNQKTGLEVYIAGATQKFVTVTGNTISPASMESRGDQLQAVLDKYMVRTQKPVPTPAEVSTASLDDLPLIGKIKASRSGELFSRLWAGDTTGYQSQSEADIALCDILAFWTRRDTAQMDRLFRQSGLMREKWDRRQSGSTYGAITVQNAVTSCQEVYDPQAHFQKKASSFTKAAADETISLADLHPDKNERYGWNDIGSGYLFADWYKDRARYVPERKKWFIYDGKVWRADTGNLLVMELCKKLADALVDYALSIHDECQRKAYLDFACRWQRRAYRETILKDAASVYPVRHEEFDADPYLFNCQNGTLDLRTRAFHAHRAADMLSKISGAKYDPAARCERWERFIDEVMEGDQNKAVFLQKALGYTLTGDTSRECFFILYGSKSRNGKGTTMETHMRVMGDYGRASKPDTIAQRQTANGSAPSEDIARLAGARFVNISEPDKRLVLSAALVKTLTGNDTINARFLNENSFEYRPQFKLFINTNHLPAVTDVTLFSSGRVNVIPFERHFGEAERDPALKGQLAQPESLSGILNWCIEGFRLMHETGLTPPESVIAATDQYRRDSDKISRFIADEMEAGFGYEVRTSDAFDRYRRWCYANGFKEGSIKTFNADMENTLTLERKRPQSGGGATTMIVGYKLRPDSNAFPGAASL
ncbi:MAG: phage/plasmid primase, P4 family [Oscillospiraceae bacterium]|nr:phage/plasmid primase, P4 family [Oscillospiraceae bacterium]